MIFLRLFSCLKKLKEKQKNKSNFFQSKKVPTSSQTPSQYWTLGVIYPPQKSPFVYAGF